MTAGRPINNLAGKKFNQLKAIKFNHKDKNGNACWIFKCDCGKIKIIGGYKVVNGKIVSCGCWRKKRLFKHGFSGKGNKFYNIWLSIHRRCNNPNIKEYKNYGGRGIKVEWKSFNEFKNDIYKSYLQHSKLFGEKNTTIDRINNDENYSKSNYRWAIMKEQARNTRRTKLITYKGKTQCILDWSKELKIPWMVIKYRVFIAHWDLDRAFIYP